MSQFGHPLVFWATGLLADALLGWTLARRRVGLTEREEPGRRAPVSLVVQDPQRFQPLHARRSA
jgi:hypothetical protein